MSCPRCGSGEAVSKAEAWDALTEIPPKTKKELEKLRRVSDAARNVLVSVGVTGDEKTVVTTVPVALLDELRRVFEVSP